MWVSINNERVFAMCSKTHYRHEPPRRMRLLRSYEVIYTGIGCREKYWYTRCARKYLLMCCRFLHGLVSISIVLYLERFQKLCMSCCFWFLGHCTDFEAWLDSNGVRNYESSCGTEATPVAQNTECKATCLHGYQFSEGVIEKTFACQSSLAPDWSDEDVGTCLPGTSFISFEIICVHDGMNWTVCIYRCSDVSLPKRSSCGVLHFNICTILKNCGHNDIISTSFCLRRCS